MAIIETYPLNHILVSHTLFGIYGFKEVFDDLNYSQEEFKVFDSPNCSQIRSTEESSMGYLTICDKKELFHPVLDIIFKDDLPIGFVNYEFYDTYTSKTRPKVRTSVWISPNQRGEGLASQYYQGRLQQQLLSILNNPHADFECLTHIVRRSDAHSLLSNELGWHLKEAFDQRLARSQRWTDSFAKPLEYLGYDVLVAIQAAILADGTPYIEPQLLEKVFWAEKDQPHTTFSA